MAVPSGYQIYEPVTTQDDTSAAAAVLILPSFMFPSSLMSTLASDLPKTVQATCRGHHSYF